MVLSMAAQAFCEARAGPGLPYTAAGEAASDSKEGEMNI